MDPLLVELRSAMYDGGPGHKDRVRDAIGKAREEIARLSNQSSGAIQLIEFLGKHSTEQAAEIKRLRGALEEILKFNGDEGDWMRAVAVKALGVDEQKARDA